jgi:methionine biosynthesis protein MetW
MNRVKPYYEKYWSDNGFCPHGRNWPELTELYLNNITPGSKVLDVGCGDGQTSGIWLTDHGAIYTGVDISENALRYARKFGLCCMQIEDATRLPFLDNTFDAVISVEVLEHLLAPQLALEEISRVLVPGGKLIVTVPNVAFWRWRFDFFFLGRWNPIGDDLSAEKPWRDPHVRFFTYRSLKRLLNETGFRSIEIAGCSGGLLKFIPYLRKFAKKDKASWLYRQLEKGMPSHFGYRIHAICQKQAIMCPLCPKSISHGQ